MKRYQKFLGFWLVNSAILYFANLVLPRYVTLGNSIFVNYQAIVFSGFIWSAVLWYIEVVLKDMEISTRKTASMMFYYLAVNFATLWFIARFAFITGVGIANFWYVAGIALVADVIQYAAWQYMEKKK